jgi:hypothetical protein
MVVRIKTGKRIQGALTYNERKVTQGKAELILASRFGAQLHQMGFSQKLERFNILIRSNQYVKRNTLHLSINFSPNDRLDTEKMQAIATDYMQRIGFGEQPFLVYYHKDTAHPHLHIVTTNIKPDGRPINMHKLAILKSEPARKTMEVEYDLIPAESVRKEAKIPIGPVNLTTIHDNPSEEKRQISNVVTMVCSSYHFTNLEEYNAILRCFNIVADPGKEGSRQRHFNGLIYAAIDENGVRVGTGIKASKIDTKPTLNVLQKRFIAAESFKEIRLSKVKEKLNKILSLPPELANHLLTSPVSKAGIDLQAEMDEQGVIASYRIVDHRHKLTTTSKAIDIPTSLLTKALITDLEHKVQQPRQRIVERKNDSVKERQDNNPSLQLLKDFLFTPETGGGGSHGKRNRKKPRKPP